MTREDLLTTYHQYKKNYLEVMGWDMKEKILKKFMFLTLMLIFL
jgi:hypothetical protein